MKVILGVFTILCSSSALAGRTSVQAGFGAANTAMHLMVDVDYQKKRSHSFGGFLVYGPENEDVRGSFFSLGADLKVFFGPKGWKVYLAPGLGIISFSSIGGSQSETTLGAVMKAGSLVRIGRGMYFGLELMYLQNWFSDEFFGGTYLLNTATFRIQF